ncbi:membrane-bound metal-dependent hydrolase [Vibrio astriarenae]|nr:membrane-bound metal-dependent hydrolase [Vibrio sp. C7]
MLSTLYLGWGYLAQQNIGQRVEDNLALQNLPNQNVIVMPTPFNTVLWRVLVLEEDKYWEGLASLLDADKRIDFVSRPLGDWPLEDKPQTLQGLKAFSHNYLNYREENGTLIVSDLRLGMANNLSFQFAYAEKDEEGQWQLLDAPLRYPSERGLQHISTLWQRLKGDQSISANLR